MQVIGVLAYTEDVLNDVTEFCQSLERRQFAVHIEQLGYNLRSSQVGYVEEKGVLVWLGRCYGDYERCQKIANWFVEEEVDLILAMKSEAVRAAAAATESASVPIVFTHISNPEDEEWSAAGKMITGVRDLWLEMAGERLALLQNVVPTPTVVHAFYNAGSRASLTEAAILQDTAQRIGMDLVLHPLTSHEEARRGLAELRTQKDHALLCTAEPFLRSVANLMGAVAHEQYIPYLGIGIDELDRCGALFTLDQKGIGAKAASLVEQIWQGAEPASIPIANPEEKVLGVNLQAAQDLGLVIPPSVQQAAQTIIPERARTSLGARLLLVLFAASVALGTIVAVAAQYDLVTLILVSLTGAGLAALVLWQYLRWRIVRPIQLLTTAAEKIGGGDLEVEIGDARVEDEIGVLGRSFRQMRSNLKYSYQELEKLTASLEQRVIERTEALNALQVAQKDLELANRRVIEADDQFRFSLTTYIHDEVLMLLDELMGAARRREDAELTDLAWQVVQCIRRVRFDLSVPIIQDIHVELLRLLQETLPQIYPTARQVQLKADLSPLHDLPELDPGRNALIYRFVSGAVSNVYRHARAKQVSVEVTIDSDWIELRVSDDGSGFASDRIDRFLQAGHYFFHDISIRAWQLGGSFKVDSSPHAGARLTLRLPLVSTAYPST